MKPILFLLSCLLCVGALQAQARFFGKVKIEYERVVYERQLVKDLDPTGYERMKDRLPEKTVTYSEFVGDTTRALYKPGRELPKDNNIRSVAGNFGDKNTVYTDFRSGRMVAQKPLFEETFLVEDSLPKIKWKLTADTRTIAGYDCHKVVGILSDSIAIFAFYTDEILVSGGPESIGGLPGMILGMGVPRLHTTWFATKVEATGVDLGSIAPPTKGKKTNFRGMMDDLQKVMKKWGPGGRYLILNLAI
ncbi:GLPGLI family protein [Paraflavisolibacter sp. H34]|uniref:GLPGLI family protein n=1 Tax=Huijunlia imazamoxiresistens TaxID=3127457 RepID=UPI003018CE64